MLSTRQRQGQIAGMIESAQLTQNLAETPLESNSETLSDKPSGKHWLFTSEMAKEAARKSVLAREKREAEAEQAKAIVGQLKAAAIVEPCELYVTNRLQRTREQLERLDRDLAAADDPKAVKAICDAMRALSEIERTLAGRPLPGSRRPGRERSSKDQGQSAAPLD